MTPVCPACRGQLTLDSYRCPRCGLAVRPTCSECGEPLTAGTDSCWRCAAPLDTPLLGATATATAVLEAPTEVAVVTPPRVRRRHPVRRFVLGVIALAIAVVCALIAFEMFKPRRTSVGAFVARDVPGQFTVEVPARWELVIDRGNAAFDDPDHPDGALGMRVVRTKGSVGETRKNLTQIEHGIYPSFEPLAAASYVTVDKHAALAYRFVAEGTLYEQWFVQRPKGMFRIDLYARGDVGDDIHAIGEHVASTFHAL